MKISLSELISKIQDEYQISGQTPSDPDELLYSRRTLWLVAMDAIEFALTTASEFETPEYPDCVHQDINSGVNNDLNDNTGSKASDVF
jgi:hypothetical protein